MDYTLYLDDMRDPIGFGYGRIIARSYDEAVRVVKMYGFPKVVDLDHDLGEGKTGSDFATWLIEYDMVHGDMPAGFEYYAHSSNPDGHKNIMVKFESYMKVKEMDK